MTTPPTPSAAPTAGTTAGPAGPTAGPAAPTLYALILAGGRASRMPADLPPKPLLERNGERLIDAAIAAAIAHGAQPLVVGPPMDLPAGVPRCQEQPAYAGPAAAIAAGLAQLPLNAADAGADAAGDADDHAAGEAPSPSAGEAWVLILAADQVEPHRLASALLAEVLGDDAGVGKEKEDAKKKEHADQGADGVIARCDGRVQPLACVLRFEAAQRAFAQVTGGSVRRALEGLRLREVELAVADIDTADDARALGIDLHDHHNLHDHHDHHDPAELSWHAARAAVAHHARPTPSDEITIAAGIGVTLAADVHAPMPVPHYTSSAMDGFAVAGDGPTWRLLARPVTGAQRSNIHSTPGTLRPGEALPVLTGSLIPEGTTGILRSEHARVEPANPDTTANPNPLADAAPAPDILHALEAPRDDIRHAGEELAAGSLLLPAGTRLHARHNAWLQACGVDTIQARRGPTVAVALTGNEVIPRGIPGPGEVRNAFNHSLPSLLRLHGSNFVTVEPLRDDPATLESWLGRTHADIVIITGGSGHSGQDFARRVLSRYPLIAGSVRCQPAHPTIVAHRPYPLADRPTSLSVRRPYPLAADDDADPAAVDTNATQLLFGLPGNPLAAFVAFHSFVVPAIASIRGEAFPATATCQLTHAIGPSRRGTRLIPARGGTPMSARNSHMLSGYALADRLLVIPATGANPGDPVSYLPLDGYHPHDG